MVPITASLDKIKDILSELGLTKREAEIYLTIALRGSATVKDLLEALDIHQPQLYNILSSLMRKGFLRVSMGRPKVYIANSIDSLIESKKFHLDILREEMEHAINELRALQREVEESETYVSITRGFNGIMTSIIEVLSSARYEVCTEMPLDVLRRGVDVFITALERGVNMYMLVFPHIPPDMVSRFKRFSNIRLRESKLGNFLLAVSDMDSAIYARRRFFSPYKPPVPAQEIYGYVIREKDLIWRLLNIFERTWRNSREIHSWSLDPKSYPKVFLEFGMALNEVEALLERGYKPIVEVEGRDVKQRRNLKLRGIVVSVNRSIDINNFILESEEGRFSVGGFDAEVEDIEAQKVVIKKVVRDEG